MKQNILIIIILIILIIIGIKGYFILKNKNYTFKNQTATDAITVKNDYESLNGTKYTYNGVEYEWSTVTIDLDNNMVALNFDEVMDLLNNGTGILYFSRATCPWCRLFTPILINFTNDINKNVYYYNVVPDRNENNENYQTLVAKLYDVLPVDTYTQNEADKDFDKTKHGVVQPMIFFVKNGKVVSYIHGFKHKYLQNNEVEEMYDLIEESYAKMAS